MTFGLKILANKHEKQMDIINNLRNKISKPIKQEFVGVRIVRCLVRHLYNIPKSEFCLDLPYPYLKSLPFFRSFHEYHKIIYFRYAIAVRPHIFYGDCVNLIQCYRIIYQILSNTIYLS